MSDDFQLRFHDGEDYPEWGARPRKPLVVFDGAHRGEWLDSVIGTHPGTGAQMIYHVLKCEYCIAIHLWPLSTPEDLAHYYQQSFYQQVKPDYLREYQEDKEWWLATHETVFDALAKHTPMREHLRMLDIGAGPGWPLVVGKQRGWETTALEQSPVAASWLGSQGHVAYEMSLAQLHQLHRRHVPRLQYELLYAWEVLEHQPNPEEFLLQCHDLLAPSGGLVVAVPNDFSPAQGEACRRFNLPPWWISAPDHQHYFTPKTLQLLLRRTGFTQRSMRMTFPLIEHFMLDQGHNYVGNPTLGRMLHQRRIAQELAAMQEGRWPALETEYVANVAQRKGREIVAIFTKEG